ncbi:hypothetical protein COJ07_06500 [Bacillus cereus]|uniref:YopX family protein n=1 Tax=Bacillus cereus TaxID=1396 RepID=UPI000BF8BFE7|nr:YopX family protein [Bacillus cereus]PFL23223.1 hypothetical protein COJ07_06500 [Bacillus cereus]
MGRFKFRTWDKTAKVMEQYHHLQLSPNGELYHDGMNVTDNYEIMQYTGLKDSDGTEIYEGDVVTWYNPLIETGERMTGVVVYDTKQATYKKCPINLYKANAGNGGYTGYEFRWYDKVNVLGNIYKNQELLKN